MTSEYFINKDGVNYPISNFDIKKQLKRGIDAGKIKVSKEVIDIIGIGNEIKIGTAAQITAGTELFAGTIENQKTGDLEGYDFQGYGAEIFNTLAEEVYRNKSPEFIVQDLIETYTGLTYASTATSGITIAKFIANGIKISDVINDLMPLIPDWIIKTDINKNFYFEPKNTTINGEGIKVNSNDSNAHLLSDWNRNPDRIVNTLTLVGDKQTFSTDEDGFTAAGGETEKVLTYTPVGNMKITKDGVELLGGIDEAVTSPDYTVDVDTKTITFTTTLIAAEVITIFYEYEVPVKISAISQDSVTTYGTRSEKITDKTIKSMADARLFVKTFFSNYANETLNAKVLKSIETTLLPGETTSVIDSYNSINSELEIQEVKYKYPEGTSQITVGSLQFDMLINEKEREARLRKLENEQDNSDIIQLYREVNNDIDVVLTQNLYARESNPQDTFILGHPTLSRLRPDLNFEADCSANTHHGTWQGTGIDGAQYVSNGYRLSAGSFNGTDNYVDVADSMAGIQCISMFVKPTQANRDLVKFSSTAKISINADNELIATGLTNVTFYIDCVESITLTSSDYQLVTILFDSHTVDDFEIGRSTTYYEGEIDEVMLFTGQLTTADMDLLMERNWYDANNAFTLSISPELYWSMDNPRLGVRRGQKQEPTTDTTFQESFTWDTTKVSATSDWDTTNKRLAMSTSDNHMTIYNTQAESGNYSLQGKNIKTVTLSATETKYNDTDQILYYVNCDDTDANWELVPSLDTEYELSNVGNYFRWKVVMIGIGGSDTYIENLTGVFDRSIVPTPIPPPAGPFNGNATLGNNIVAYYKSDTDGSYPDATGLAGAGTITGAVYTASGKINGAYDYDGINDYISLDGAYDLTSATAVTMNLWFKADATTLIRYLFSHRYGATGDDIRIVIDSNILYGVFDDGTQNFVSTPFTDTTSWHMVTLVHTGTNIKMFLDGSQIGSDVPDTFNFAGLSSTIRLGTRLPINSQYLNGKIDEFGVWDRDLTSDEITDLYNSGNGLQY